MALRRNILIFGFTAVGLAGLTPLPAKSQWHQPGHRRQEAKAETFAQNKPIDTQLRATKQEQQASASQDSEESEQDSSAAAIRPPAELKLQADLQRYDGIRQRFIAEGQVIAHLNGGTLQADRIEFDSDFNSLFARGSVRLRRGSQYFQASSLRYNLIQREGELEDVYGILDLDTVASDLSQDLTGADSSPLSRTLQGPLPVLESDGLGFPTAEDVLLNSSTAERLSPQGGLRHVLGAGDRCR